MILNYRPDDSFYKYVLIIQFALLLVKATGTGYEESKLIPSYRYRTPNDGHIIPKRLYFAIAAPSNTQNYARAFNKTLMNITQSYMSVRTKNDRYNFNVTLDMLAIELPKNGSFSARLLETVCQQFEGKHVVAVLVVGSSPAAFTVTLTAEHVGIPVIWARGQTEFLPGFRSLVSDLFGLYVYMCQSVCMHLHYFTYNIYQHLSQNVICMTVKMYYTIKLRVAAFVYRVKKCLKKCFFVLIYFRSPVLYQQKK